MIYVCVLGMFLVGVALDQIPDPVAGGTIAKVDEERDLESTGSRGSRG